MTVTSSLQHSGRARALALLALLFVLGVQFLEASHSHAHHEGAVECLACKTSSAGVATIAPASTIDESGAPVPPVEETTAVQAAACRHYDSRGPPLFS